MPSSLPLENQNEPMHGQYNDPQFRFIYPQNWTLRESSDESVRMVEVESPDRLAYLMVTVHINRSFYEIMTEALGVMVCEYKGLHSEAVEASIDGQTAQGYDLEFVTLDFPVGGFLRSIDTPEGGLLVQGQWSEVDDDSTTASHADVISAILTSIELENTYED
jgi:hypothetical protein